MKIYSKQHTYRHGTEELAPNTPTMARIFQSLDERSVILSRQQRTIEMRLQQLIDAQGEGLLQGLGKTPQPSSSVKDGHSVFGSSSPPGRSQQSQRPPSRSSTRRTVLGLKDSRRGIASSLTELVDLKKKELDFAQQHCDKSAQDLVYLQNISAREAGLMRHVSSIEGQEANSSLQGLRQEERVLGDEIATFEARLTEMRGRQQLLRHDIRALDNKIQSQLSSYRGALSLAREEIKEYLARAPESDILKEDRKSFWKLPPERRTLDVATEHLQHELDSFRTEAKDLHQEKTALEQGSLMWQDVVEIVTSVEATIRQEVERFDLREGMAETGSSANVQRLDQLLELLRTAHTQISSKLDTAQNKCWNLLVCCIGAELQAITDGSTMLHDARVAAQEPRQGNRDPSDILENYDEEDDDTLGIIRTQTASTNSPVLMRSQSDLNQAYSHEEDGPAPDLLISTGESP